MKKIILALVATAGLSTAFGLPNKDSSWDKIRSSFYEVTYQMPQIQFSNYFVTLDSTCMMGDQLRTVDALPVCVEWQGSGENFDCVREVRQHFFTPISGTRSICTRWNNSSEGGDCIEFGQVPYQIQTTINVPVYKLVHGGSQRTDWEVSTQFPPLFVKEFSVPGCN
ncbi:MAG: hypothetical protein IT288_02920 [Bdellovibrionales bacterium]|nr:hypothetical protein [Bdellovibrionales bacterium]